MPSEPVGPGVSAYLERLVAPRPRELQVMEEVAARTKFPIIGPAAGQFCYLLARLIGARAVFELGSGFGYSTAWFARAVVENGGGVVHHVVWDADLSSRARGHLQVLDLDQAVRFHVGEAVATLREATGPFDLIFNDIDKAGYPAALPVMRERLRPGGLLLADNLLWHGRVLDDADTSPDTAGIREFTRLVMADPSWTASIVPIRDGILVAQRR
ncbi:MAG TPA: O-methyltransferase [Gemmatimonadales bacterium]|nr:O-methyltransferase [Gemmatimonadales bacterium]